MKTGIEMITERRTVQLNKLGYTPESDKAYIKKELLGVATAIAHKEPSFFPHSWRIEIYSKLANKSYVERLADAGALIAAEIDRIIAQE